MSSAAANATSAPTSFLSKFTVLHGAVRELWVVFIVKLLGIVAYSVMNTTFVLWLSYDLGYSDEKAGFLVAAWSTAMTLLVVFVGSLTDAIGLRKALLLGIGVCALSRGVMTFTTIKWLALAAGMFPLALGEALGVPVLVAGIRRYSTTNQRSISFAIFYAMMNVGFLIASYIFDYVRQGLGEPHGHFLVPVLNLDFTTYRALFLLSFLFEATLLPLVYFGVRDGVEATDEGVKITPEQPKYPGAGLWRAFSLMARDATRETARIFAGLWRQPGFHKFLAFLTFAAFVRLIFIHMYYTYPKFGIRELGEGAPVGRLFAINSVLIIFLVPIVGALSQKIAAYRMVMVGSLIAAASVFIMAMPPGWFSALADGPLGHGIANRWLGGYDRFSPDDFRELPSLARTSLSPSNPVVSTVSHALSPSTLTLLHRELESSPLPFPSMRHPSSALMAPNDFHELALLLSKLQTDKDQATAPISKFLWIRFSPHNKAVLQDPRAADPNKRRALADEFNRVLNGNALYDEQRFANIRLSESAHALLVKDPKKQKPALPNQSVLFYRVLLEDTYPRHIPRSEHMLRVALAQDFTRVIHNGRLPSSDAQATKSGTVRRDQNPVRFNRLVLEQEFSTELSANRVGVPGSVNPYYVMVFLFIVLLSIGESIYSPRLYEYAAVIAPKGQEASYMALSYLPFFLAKLIVAMFSGILLEAYCPAAGPRDSQILWLIIALITTIAPLGLILLRRFIQVHEEGRA